MSGDWTQRELCPDGACIGVIGPDGTCKVCGRAAPNWGDERRRGLAASTEDEDETRETADRDEDDDEDEEGADYEEGDGDEDDDDDDDDADSDDEDSDDDDDDDESEAEADEDGAVIASNHGTDATASDSAKATKGGAPKAEWSARKLCPDGSCIGVIGPNGTCKVCGKRGE